MQAGAEMDDLHRRGHMWRVEFVCFVPSPHAISNIWDYILATRAMLLRDCLTCIAVCGLAEHYSDLG